MCPSRAGALLVSGGFTRATLLSFSSGFWSKHDALYILFMSVPGKSHVLGSLFPAPGDVLCSALVYVESGPLISGNEQKSSYNVFYRQFRNLESYPLGHNDCHVFTSLAVNVFLGSPNDWVLEKLNIN